MPKARNSTIMTYNIHRAFPLGNPCRNKCLPVRHLPNKLNQGISVEDSRFRIRESKNGGPSLRGRLVFLFFNSFMASAFSKSLVFALSPKAAVYLGIMRYIVHARTREYTCPSNNKL